VAYLHGDRGAAPRISKIQQQERPPATPVADRRRLRRSSGKPIDGDCYGHQRHNTGITAADVVT
jgi:hypothetical protein